MNREEPQASDGLDEEEVQRMLDPDGRGVDLSLDAGDAMPHAVPKVMAVGVTAAAVAAAAAVVSAVTAAAEAVITALSNLAYRTAAIETVNLTDKELKFRLPSYFWAGHLAEFPEPMSIPRDKKGTFGAQKTKGSAWGVGGISAASFDGVKDVLLFYVNPTAGRAAHGCWFVAAGTPLDRRTFNSCWYEIYGGKKATDVTLERTHQNYETWSNIGQAATAHMQAIVYDKTRDYGD